MKLFQICQWFVNFSDDTTTSFVIMLVYRDEEIMKTGKITNLPNQIMFSIAIEVKALYYQWTVLQINFEK